MAKLPLGKWPSVEVDDRGALLEQLGLDKVTEAKKVSEFLKDADQRYLDLEAPNTTWHFDEKGTLWVLIKPFSKQLTVLESNLGKQIDAAVKDQKPQVVARARWFYGNTYGRQHALIRIWMNGSGYNWQIDESDRPIFFAQGYSNYQGGPQLPPHLQRFWDHLVLQNLGPPRAPLPPP